MNWRYVSRLLTPFLFLALNVSAQKVPCIFTLELGNSLKEGWNTASLEVRINQNSNVFTLTEGFSEKFFLYLTDGDSLRLTFLPGATGDGIFYRLYAPAGDTVFNSGPLPLAGVTFRQAVRCPSCSPPPVFGIKLDDIRAFTAQMSWVSSDPNGTYLVEVDTAGFTRGKGKIVPVKGSSVKLTGLKERTRYQFYLSVRCSAGDTSQVLGPFAFQTLWANDVGVKQIVAPESSCNLRNDTVKVRIANYGGEPQSLIPFAYAVNGRKVPIDMPRDGLYTGVVGKDSVEAAQFDQTFNFSTPGEYLIQAWTELKDDREVKNDTARWLVVSVPSVNVYPNLNTLETAFTGWYVASASQNPSWSAGKPRGQILNGAFAGTRAWSSAVNYAYNNNEFSYLMSPCFDFSNQTKDGQLSFALQLDLEAAADGAWVEMSTDEGKTWSRLGSFGTGVNWYNNSDRQVWTGNGGYNSWFIASHPMPGTAGKRNVRLRFVLRSDFSNALEGISIDNIVVSIPGSDLAALSVRNNGALSCGNASDQVTMTIGNLGTAVASNLQVAFQVNNGPVVQESLGNRSINPQQQTEFTFTTRFNSLAPGEYRIKAWVLGNDGLVVNDTAYYAFYSARPMPFSENFERGAAPRDWSIDSDVVVVKERNNTSFVLSDNLFNGDRTMRATTPAFGPIAATDSLTFDYRFTDFSGNGLTPFTLGPNDKLEVQISNNCGQTFTTVATISRTNHTPTAAMTRFSVKLNTFIGQYIQVRFLASWGQGDYFVDLDNVRVVSCPASLNLSIFRTGTANQPTLTVQSGQNTGPFTYRWSNGATTATIPLAGNGNYEVTVTNLYGCTDKANTLVTGVPELIPVESLVLAPNPTTGMTILKVQFLEEMDATIQLLNPFGQLLRQSRFGRASRVEMEMDLSEYAKGLYFVRILANGKSRTEKLILVK